MSNFVIYLAAERKLEEPRGILGLFCVHSEIDNKGSIGV